MSLLRSLLPGLAHHTDGRGISHEIDSESITKELSIVPEKSLKKGEQTVSKHSGSIITNPHNLWSIRSKSSELEEETISHHIEYFKSIFLLKAEVLKKFKEDAIPWSVCLLSAVAWHTDRNVYSW